MKTALLAWTALEPPDSGYRIRARAIIRHLPVEQLRLIAPPPRIDGADFVALPPYWTERLNMPLPFNREVLGLFGKSGARQTAVGALEEFRPDVILCEGIWGFPAAQEYRKRQKSFLVVDADCIEFTAAEYQGRPTLKSQLLREYEKKVYSQCDALVAVSEVDRQILNLQLGIPSERILLLPNGIEPFNISPASGIELRQRVDEKVILFMGKLDYAPNREAVDWIFRELLPHLAMVPHIIRLVLLGTPVPPQRPAVLPSNVRLIMPGWVPQIAPYLHAADVCICPIFSGSGTRIKILEYLSAGKPVVATRKAVEGLLIESGKHYQLADTPEEMAGKIAHLLSQEIAARHMSIRARAFVEKHYLWENLVSRFYGDLEQMLPANREMR